jgi:hypothetical protein
MARRRGAKSDNDFPQPCAIMIASCFRGPIAMLRAFTDHPETVGETYLQHMGSAWGFAGTMFVGAAACLLHGIFPFAFQKAGSRRIVELHQRMVANRHRAPEGQGYLGVAEGI